MMKGSLFVIVWLKYKGFFKHISSTLRVEKDYWFQDCWIGTITVFVLEIGAGRFQRMHLLNSLSIATLSEPGWRQLLCWRRWCKVAGMFRDAESMGGHWAGINYEGWYIVLACLLSKGLQHHWWEFVWLLKRITCRFTIMAILEDKIPISNMNTRKKTFKIISLSCVCKVTANFLRIQI